MKNPFLATVALSLLFISLVALTACNAPNKSAEWQTMTLIKSKSELVEVHDLDGTREHGEQVFFESELTDQVGQKVGQAIGMMVIVDIAGDDGVGNPEIEERFSTLAIVFEDGDEIMTMGALVYPVGERLMQANLPQMRAIIGGTGKYKGIRGQLTMTRDPDESYMLELEYKMD